MKKPRCQNRGFFESMDTTPVLPWIIRVFFSEYIVKDIKSS